MESFFSLSGLLQKQDSIFYFLLFLAGLCLVLLESHRVFKARREQKVISSLQNGDALWVLIPWLTLLCLSFVHWQKMDNTNFEAKNPSPIPSVESL